MKNKTLRNLKYRYRYFMIRNSKRIKGLALLTLIALVYGWYFFHWGVQYQKQTTPGYRACERAAIEYRIESLIYEYLLDEIRNPSPPGLWTERYKDWREN